MKLYPENSESCLCNPGNHLYVDISQRMSSIHGRGSGYQHPAGLSPGLEQLGRLSYSSGQFHKGLVISLTRVISMFCTVLMGIQWGWRRKHLLNGARSHFFAAHQTQLLMPGSRVSGGKEQSLLLPSGWQGKSCHEETRSLLLLSI